MAPAGNGACRGESLLELAGNRRQEAAATQNFALNALVFRYAPGFEKPPDEIGETIRAKRPPRLPVVLSHQETITITARASLYELLAALMYGFGLRVVEAERLRIDIRLLGQMFVGVRSPLDGGADAGMRCFNGRSDGGDPCRQRVYSEQEPEVNPFLRPRSSSTKAYSHHRHVCDLAISSPRLRLIVAGFFRDSLA